MFIGMDHIVVETYKFQIKCWGEMIDLAVNIDDLGSQQICSFLSYTQFLHIT